MNEPRPRWVGWVWQRGHWRRVCEAETLAACSRLLGEQARQLGIRDKHTILTAGAVPSIVPLESHRIAPHAAGSVKPARRLSGEREGR